MTLHIQICVQICLDEYIAPRFNSCLVYSFGVGGDLTFEDEIYNFAKCDIFLFDPTVTVAEMRNVSLDFYMNDTYNYIITVNKAITRVGTISNTRKQLEVKT